MQTSANVALGSPRYMSPEQIQTPRDVDARCDVWAMGVVLYEALAGRPPFEGEGMVEVATAITTRVPMPLPNRVPAALANVVMRCLQKDRRLRPASAADLASALKPFGSVEAQLVADRVVRAAGAPNLSRDARVDPADFRVRADGCAQRDAPQAAIALGGNSREHRGARVHRGHRDLRHLAAQAARRAIGRRSATADRGDDGSDGDCVDPGGARRVDRTARSGHGGDRSRATHAARAGSRDDDDDSNCDGDCDCNGDHHVHRQRSASRSKINQNAKPVGVSRIGERRFAIVMF